MGCNRRPAGMFLNMWQVHSIVCSHLTCCVWMASYVPQILLQLKELSRLPLLTDDLPPSVQRDRIRPVLRELMDMFSFYPSEHLLNEAALLASGAAEYSDFRANNIGYFSRLQTLVSNPPQQRSHPASPLNISSVEYYLLSHS